MNRILFEPGEIADGVATVGGVRAEHILSVLHGEVGQPLKTGVVGGLAGTSEIIAVSAPGETPRVSVRVCHDTPAPAPWIDLVLAPPRPRVLKRLLPQLAALGVGRIVLVGARKVEKDFWGATLLKEEIHRPLLVEGLMQCGATVLPELLVRRNFRRFLEDELDSLFPDSARLVAHPTTQPPAFAKATAGKPNHPTTRLRQGYGGQAQPPAPSSKLQALSSKLPAPQPRPLLAIGPEGGWTDAEVGLLESRGFKRFSLGPRILRTDTATIALIAILSPNHQL